MRYESFFTLDKPHRSKEGSDFTTSNVDEEIEINLTRAGEISPNPVSDDQLTSDDERGNVRVKRGL